MTVRRFLVRARVLRTTGGGHRSGCRGDGLPPSDPPPATARAAEDARATGRHWQRARPCFPPLRRRRTDEADRAGADRSSRRYDFRPSVSRTRRILVVRRTFRPNRYLPPPSTPRPLVINRFRCCRRPDFVEFALCASRCTTDRISRLVFETKFRPFSLNVFELPGHDFVVVQIDRRLSPFARHVSTRLDTTTNGRVATNWSRFPCGSAKSVEIRASTSFADNRFHRVNKFLPHGHRKTVGTFRVKNVFP